MQMDEVLPEIPGKRAALVLLVLAASFAGSPAPSSTVSSQTAPAATSLPGYLEPLPQDTGVPGLRQELRRLENTGRLMMVVAHPDDEDGGLLTLESRGKGVAALLLTLTRGEGGQNKTGDTFSDELGILRTLELLAAGRYYGVEQRFTRAADFGYSKTAEETFEKWGGHDPTLQDIVWVIREFRPDVLVARFSGTTADGHGHHQASAILTKEAFRAAGDRARFPEQIRQGLEPWQPKKLYIGNVCGFGASSCPDENWTVKLNTGEVDPLLGMSYVQFAIEGLRHQQSQGLGDLRTPSGPRYAFYKLSDSVLAKTTDANGHEKDFFDGIDTRLQGLVTAGGHAATREKLEQAATQISGAAQAADGNAESAARPLLSALRLLDGVAGGAPKTPEGQTVGVKLGDKERQVRTAINLALNLRVTATLTSPSTAGGDRKDLTGVSPGEAFRVKVTLSNGSGHPLALRRLALDGKASPKSLVEDRSRQPVAAGEDYEHTFELRLPEIPYTRPGLHRKDPQRDSLYTVDSPSLATLPFGALPPATVRASYVVPDLTPVEKPGERGDTKLPEISTPVLAPVLYADGVSRRQELAVVPAFSVSIRPGDEVVPAATSAPVNVSVKVRSNLEGTQQGTLRLKAPAGWKVSPEEQVASLGGRGEEKTFKFELSHPLLEQGGVAVRAVLSSGGREFSEGYQLVTREDLGSFHYFEPALQHISVVDVKVPQDLQTGYIMGAGDDIPTVLEQVGMKVTLIPADKIATEDLSQFGTVVLGVRAYDTQSDLAANNSKLLDFVSSGGTLIVQNNNSVSDFNAGRFTPYPAELSRARVSVEDAPVTILAPEDPIFHYPNQISQKDFEGWVQERGLYFMSSWDDRFRPLLSCHDPGEPEQKGGLLVAKYGKGVYIYTGYAFFRQLPAGVPGAIRLFVNLVSAGKGASRS